MKFQCEFKKWFWRPPSALTTIFRRIQNPKKNAGKSFRNNNFGILKKTKPPLNQYPHWINTSLIESIPPPWTNTPIESIPPLNQYPSLNQYPHCFFRCVFYFFWRFQPAHSDFSGDFQIFGVWMVRAASRPPEILDTSRSRSSPNPIFWVTLAKIEVGGSIERLYIILVYGFACILVHVGVRRGIWDRRPSPHRPAREEDGCGHRIRPLRGYQPKNYSNVPAKFPFRRSPRVAACPISRTRPHFFLRILIPPTYFPRFGSCPFRVLSV